MGGGGASRSDSPGSPGGSPAIVQDLIGHESAEISAHDTHIDGTVPGEQEGPQFRMDILWSEQMGGKWRNYSGRIYSRVVALFRRLVEERESRVAKI